MKGRRKQVLAYGLPSLVLRELYFRYGCCMAYVAGRLDGVDGIGSAFHVGDGILVTAGHVIAGAEIREVCLTSTAIASHSPLFALR